LTFEKREGATLLPLDTLEKGKFEPLPLDTLEIREA
jgi:hypothetical protein